MSTASNYIGGANNETEQELILFNGSDAAKGIINPEYKRSGFTNN